MADENSKTQTIDDLMKELTSRSSQNSQPQKPANPFPSPRTAPVSGIMSGNPASQQPQSIPVPTPQAAKPAEPSRPTPQQSGGYQSSIRTMTDDISRLNQGQKPAGVNIPRKIEPIAPMPQKPVEPKITPPPLPSAAPMPPRPTAPPAQQFQSPKAPQVSLGGAQKAQAMPSQAKETPKPQPAPMKPAAIYVPEASQGANGINRKMLYGGLVALVIVAGVLYWFLVMRSSDSEIVEQSPTPAPTEVIVPNLDDIFNYPITSATIENTDQARSLWEVVELLDLAGGTFNVISPLQSSDGSVVSIAEIIDFPQEVIDNLGNDSIVLAYGQKEAFDSKGMPITPIKIMDKLAFIFEAKDRNLLNQALLNWEETMGLDFEEVFAYEAAKQSAAVFQDNYYQGSLIRYKNFAYPHQALDYSMVLGSNAKTYLVITGSRESMYAVTDKIKGILIQEPVPSGK